MYLSNRTISCIWREGQIKKQADGQHDPLIFCEEKDKILEDIATGQWSHKVNELQETFFNRDFTVDRKGLKLQAPGLVALIKPRRCIGAFFTVRRE